MNNKLFFSILKSLGLPEPISEYKFHPKRRWRMDYAFVEKKISIEIDGGAWMSLHGKKSRHFHGNGAILDMEKHSAAAELGWKILRYPPNKIDYEQIKRTFIQN